MTDIGAVLDSIRDVLQEDVGARGLRSDPHDNLITAFPDDFARAAQSLAAAPNGTVGILTGFFIPHADPPCGETDGPLGAVFLARALVSIGSRIVIYTDDFCVRAIEVGLRTAGLNEGALVVPLPGQFTPAEATERVRADGLTHLVALERVGPSHTVDSIRAQASGDLGVLDEFLNEIPEQERDRLHNMRGLDITHWMAPGQLLVEVANVQGSGILTIGIGDGGNEIGMGKIPWRVIRKNIARGGLIACRTATQHLIVCGVSNWGAYGLGFAVNLLRGRTGLDELLAEAKEFAILEAMVEQGPLVDGVSGKQTLSVDGLPFDRYIEPLRRFRAIAVAELSR
jgi:hypothetical protein